MVKKDMGYVKRDKCVHKVDGHMHKKVHIYCCCAGSDEGVKEEKNY